MVETKQLKSQLIAVAPAARDEMPSHAVHTQRLQRQRLHCKLCMPIEILSKEGRSVTTYALLDTGSEETFPFTSISEKHGIQIGNYDALAVCTLSGESAVRAGEVNVKVRAAGNRVSRTVKVTKMVRL